MKRLFTHIVLIVLICACVCRAAGSTPKEGDVVATVGTHAITRQMLDHIIDTIPEENRVPFLTPDGRKKILDEVISFMLFAEAAKAKGIDKEPAIKTRLDYTQTEYLSREYFRRQMAEIPPVSEAEMKAYFKDHAQEFKPPEEIKARHILLQTEADANKVLAEVKAGKDFEELARKNSIDPAAASGGRLALPDGREWLPKGTFEASFEHALSKIPKGQVGGPIKTQFGWHILKVEDRRQPEMPSFVQVRSAIKNRLEEQKRAELHRKITEELKKTYPVTIK
ncbi:MAG: peptidyl-prolyl cis-trans isomerase [Desulfomonile sp.]|nr:peptidyl-prolyl cis-trans isomerase [Desulfomonile sp.]